MIYSGVEAGAESPPNLQRWLSDVQPARLLVEAECVLQIINKPGLFDQPLTAQDEETMDGMDTASRTYGTTIKTTALITSFIINLSTTLARNHE